MPSRDEQIARMAAQKAAVEYVKGWKPTPADTTLKRWIDFFYDDIMDLDPESAPNARLGGEGGMPASPKPGDRLLTDDEEARVLTAIKDSGKRLDLILRSIGRDKAESLTVNDSKQIKALLA